MTTLMRTITLEIVITLMATGAAWGVVELLRWALDLPAPAIPVLPLILVTIVATRLITSGWMVRLLKSK